MSDKTITTEELPFPVELAAGVKAKPKKKKAPKKPKPAPKPVEQPVKILPVPEPAPVPMPPSEPVPTPAKPTPKPAPTPAQNIWEKIKERTLDIFGLQGQKVKDYSEPVSMDPLRCFLKFKHSAAIPAIETATPDYEFEQAGRYIILSPKNPHA